MDSAGVRLVNDHCLPCIVKKNTTSCSYKTFRLIAIRLHLPQITIINVRCYFSQVVSMNIRQDVMIRLYVGLLLRGDIAEKLVDVATVSILLNSTS